MVYGDEKVRDMSRSLLPSKNREAARQARARVHRSARRQSRVEMAWLARDPESFEDLAGLDDDGTVEIRQVVDLRRGGDKLSPFIRWARAITRRMPQHSRMGHLRGLVPRGVIGDHALLHLSNRKDFEHPNETAQREAWQRAWRTRRTPYFLDPRVHEELLRAVLSAPDGHRTFNLWLRWGHTRDTPHERRPSGARMLFGLHDVQPFLFAHWGRRGTNPDRWASPRGPYAAHTGAVDLFLRAFKHCRGDVAATVKTLRFDWPGMATPARSPVARPEARW
jgi:hypothetical protein